MRVGLYLPDRLYGFCESDEGGQVFFHASAFHPVGEGEPPPVIGEAVEVEVDPTEVRGAPRAPRAASVRRVASPQKLGGLVAAFDASTGWGFIAGDDHREYFLHRSDVVDNRVPVRGQRVEFYPGHKRGRPRACHVEV